MEIHHYTKALTLPLILASKKLRFTRADALDDMAEIPFKNTHIDARKFFISSWTTVSGEHSGQWARYGDHDAGVRLTFKASPFLYDTLDFVISRDRKPEEGGGQYGVKVDRVVAPFSKATMFGNGYMLHAYCHDMREEFGGQVVYVSDPASYAAQFVSASADETEIRGGAALARVKSSGWVDQCEYRFVLMAVAGPRLDFTSEVELYEQAFLDLLEENEKSGSIIQPSNVTFIDLPFDPTALDSFEVTLGPKISSENRHAVLQAIELHAPHAIVRESAMRVR